MGKVKDLYIEMMNRQPTLMSLSETLSAVSHSRGLVAHARYTNILKIISSSLISETTINCYDLLFSNYQKLIDELMETTNDLLILAEEPNFNIDNSKLSTVINSCLILFRARLFLQPSQIDPSELPLLELIDKAPSNLTASDRQWWVATPAIINEIRYTQSLQRYKEIAAEIHTSEKKVVEIESSLTDLAKETLNKISIKMDESSTSLSKAFGELKDQKAKQLKLPRYAMAFFSILVLIAISIELGFVLLGTSGIELPWYWLLIKSLGFIFVALFLVYFFRVALSQYNTIRNEMLQLEIRESLCQFIPAYRQFTKFTDCSVEDFARHIFSPLQVTNNSTPHPMDSMGALLQVINEAKKLGVPLEEKSKLL